MHSLMPRALRTSSVGEDVCVCRKVYKFLLRTSSVGEDVCVCRKVYKFLLRSRGVKQRIFSLFFFRLEAILTAFELLFHV